MSTKQNISNPLHLEEVKDQLVVINATTLIQLIGNKFQEIIQKEKKEEENSKQTTSPNSDLLTMPEVIELLKVSKVTIHNWKKKGIIKSHKIGRKLFFKKTEILEAVKRQNYTNFAN